MTTTKNADAGEPARCPLFHWQYQCTRHGPHDEHEVQFDDGRWYRWRGDGGRGLFDSDSNPRDVRQAKVAEWVTLAFGAEQATSIEQRGIRLLEEAVEAYQAAGGIKHMAHNLVDFVFGRPVGKSVTLDLRARVAEHAAAGVASSALGQAIGVDLAKPGAERAAMVTVAVRDDDVRVFERRIGEGINTAVAQSIGIGAGGEALGGEPALDQDVSTAFLVSPGELDKLIGHYGSEDHARQSGGGWKTLAALRELRARRKEEARAPEHVHVFLESKCSSPGKTHEALDVCEACERQVLADVEGQAVKAQLDAMRRQRDRAVIDADRFAGLAEVCGGVAARALDRIEALKISENHARCEAAGLRVELKNARDANNKLRSQLDEAMKEATRSGAAEVALLDRLGVVLGIEEEDDCGRVIHDEPRLLAEAAKAAWQAKVLRSIVGEDDLRALESKIRGGVASKVDDGLARTERDELARSQAALRKLVARVQRVGGYADTADQLALTEALDALKAAGEAG